MPMPYSTFPSMGFQSNLGAQFDFSLNAPPGAQPSFLEQLSQTSYPAPAHVDPNLAANSAFSTGVQYRVEPTNFQTPTPVRTMTNRPGPSHPIPSYYPQNQPLANYPPYDTTSQIPSKTPSRKVMQANVVGFIAKHRKYRSRGSRKRAQALTGSRRSPSEGLNGPTTELQPANNSVPGATYNDAKPILRKAVFYQLVAVELWPIGLGALRQAALDFLHSTPGGPALVALTEQDPKFSRLASHTLRNMPQTC
ncbi:hypothetical protein FRC08_005277 [Ceratobasidium sp. 394]|nr:hypothetical protein FRC08_005277 [Ceratobasidium sp. 394]